MTTVVLYGPQGSGKSKFVERIKSAYGIDDVVEEWVPHEGLRTGALHITTADQYELQPIHMRLDDDLEAVHMYSSAMLAVLFKGD